MISAAARAFRRLSHKAGFDVRRWPAIDPFYENLVQLLGSLGVDVVLDVGGNTGQFVRRLRQAGFKGRAVSFEPASVSHAALTAAAAGDDLWSVAPPMALGSDNGEIVLNLYNRSDMNSVHSLNTIAQDVFPKLVAAGSETVPLRKLDDIFTDFVRPGETPFLKLDTQGSERAILQGAERVLSSLPVVQAELSLVPLYDGGIHFDDIFDFLRGQGFRLGMVAPVTFSKRLGRQIEADAVFVR
jgi:FkbM family methyltransferase